MDIASTTQPRSDQQNFDDYSAGGKTLSITEVRAGTAEQPVEIHVAEFPGRPYKPSKSMRRVLVAAWGSEAAAYVGRRIRLIGDPTVRFGRDVVGGIKIEALSHIDGPVTVSLTVTRGKRAPYVVQPLKEAPEPPVAPDKVQAAVAAIRKAPDAETLRAIEEHAGKVGIADNADVIEALKAKRDELSF